MHFRVARYLRGPSLTATFVYDAADHALAARSLGVYRDTDEDLVALLLRAVSRSALSASFVAAKRHLDAADGEYPSRLPLNKDIIKASGGRVRWMQRHRAAYLHFVELHSNVCGVLKLHEQASEKVMASPVSGANASWTV